MAKKKEIAGDDAVEGGNVATSQGAVVADTKATVDGFWSVEMEDAAGNVATEVVAADTAEAARGVVTALEGRKVVSVSEYVGDLQATMYVWARVPRDAGEGQTIMLTLKTHASKTLQYRG